MVRERSASAHPAHHLTCGYPMTPRTSGLQCAMCAEVRGSNSRAPKTPGEQIFSQVTAHPGHPTGGTVGEGRWIDHDVTA